MNKKNLTKIILILTILVTISAVITLIVVEGLKGYYFAVAQGLIAVNLLISLFFVRKNFK